MPHAIKMKGRYLLGAFARTQRGSILIVVLVTLMVATLALTLFIEKASDDLLVETRALDTQRLRSEAYSALEASLCVLNEFKLVNGGLRSPAEGWGEPLDFANYEPTEGRKVQVQFIDESGKLSLSAQTTAGLTAVFEAWDFPKTDAETLADALMDWTTADYVASSGYSNSYEEDEIPFGSPLRPLRTWSELEAIDKVRELFFDENGMPTENWRRFTETFSLLKFKKSNVNAAQPGVLAALGLTEQQQGQINDFLTGTGSYKTTGAGYFKSAEEASTLVGGTADLSSLGVEINALRIIITVREGRSSYRLNVVISTSNSAASTVTKKAAPSNRIRSGTTSASDATDASDEASSSSAQKSTGKETSLNYPFTVLEIRENDAMSQPEPQLENNSAQQ